MLCVPHPSLCGIEKGVRGGEAVLGRQWQELGREHGLSLDLG